MASTVPASLKSADITRFAVRASQLEKAKPAVAYWCNYWILNQILAKNLHNADAEALTYTTGLMDKVEQFKSANANNDAVIDDIAGKAYIEQFAQEVFGKADGAVRANRVTVGTADTFQAAATFLELLAVWGSIEPEMTTKIKYAKFHAVRILKAVKAGEDPNLSNPKPEPEPSELLPQLDPNDAEVRALEGDAPDQRRASVVEVPDEAHRVQARLADTSNLDESLHPSREQSQARPPHPSVVEVADEAHRIQTRLAKTSAQDESLHPSRVPSRPTSTAGGVSPPSPPDAAAFYTSYENDISPMDPPAVRKPSIGGNYFPEVSKDIGLDLPSAPSEPTLPQPPATFPSDNMVQSPSNPELGAFIPPTPPQNGQPAMPPTTASQPTPQHLQQPPPPPPPTRQQHHQQPTAPPQIQQAPQHQPPQPFRPQQYTQQPQQPPPQPHNVVYAPPSNQMNPPPPIVQPVIQPPVQTNVVVDEEAIMKAQKHARWAISALNFEDVPTAIRELQGALAMLGAR